MQRSGCDENGILISKYVDGEAAPEERAQVEVHVASCESCAQKLTSFMEMAAIFSDVEKRMPEPHLRLSLFSQIERIKAEDERLERISRLPTPPAPVYPPQRGTPTRSIGARIWAAASPFAVVGAAMFVLLAFVALAVRPTADEPGDAVLPAVAADPESLLVAGVPTIPFRNAQASEIPSPVVTKGIARPPGAATVSATARRAAAAGETLELQRPTPVFEQGDTERIGDWHVVRDPVTGYAVQYPPNWWNEAAGKRRTFLPWGPGGASFAPYWVDLEVSGNPRLLDAESANLDMFSGTCAPVESSAQGSSCRRSNYLEGSLVYDELYAFDARHIYKLRLAVPVDSPLGEFDARWAEAQRIFSRMSGSLALAGDAAAPGYGYGPVLFLNSTDLWAVDGRSGQSRPVTRGYGVRSYSLAQDLRRIAFTATNDHNNQFAEASYLYLADAEAGVGAMPRLLWSGVELFDVAWYGDRELIVLARGEVDGLALYRVSVPRELSTEGSSADAERTLLASLDRGLRGARGLAVSPDRQLITFLAPLGEGEGTEVYAVRPDGTDLIKVVSHETVRPPGVGSTPAADPADLAVKGYVWTAGRLEHDGYAFSMLFTCGVNTSPTLFRGGYLFMGVGETVLHPDRLQVDQPEAVQIVHVAYSPRGKVAFTGFYSLKDGRAEVLAGLWTADLKDGNLSNLRSMPLPPAPNGIADLQWAPDGNHLIYRETMPQDQSELVSRYGSGTRYLLVKLDPVTGERVILHDGR